VSHTFELEIVTPERLVVRDRVEEMQLPGRDGYLGILPGHAPLITELGIGQISYRENGRSRYLAVAWGFAEVLPDRVSVLAETAERAEEIDVRRAEEAMKRAEQRLKSGDPKIDCVRAQYALTRAASPHKKLHTSNCLALSNMTAQLSV
jgi:F-type H+-transporting ATPase subunit epsilon